MAGLEENLASKERFSGNNWKSINPSHPSAVKPQIPSAGHHHQVVWEELHSKNEAQMLFSKCILSSEEPQKRQHLNVVAIRGKISRCSSVFAAFMRKLYKPVVAYGKLWLFPLVLTRAVAKSVKDTKLEGYQTARGRVGRSGWRALEHQYLLTLTGPP